jgi:hypothetical protein
MPPVSGTSRRAGTSKYTMAGRSAPALFALLSLTATCTALAGAEAAGASCPTGPIPTTEYVGTVVDRVAAEPEDYHLRLDDGRVVVLQIAPRDREEGFAGPLPVVGHRYRVVGAAVEVQGAEYIALDGCVPSAQLVELVAPPGAPSGQTGSNAGAAAAVAVALLGAAALIIGHRRVARHDSGG